MKRIPTLNLEPRGCLRLPVSFLAIVLLLAACRPREKLLNDATVFPALSGQGQFQLSAVDPRIAKVVVNFFAPDCPPCEKELPALKQFYQAHAADKDMLFVSIGSSLRAIGNPDAGKAPADSEIRSEISRFIRKFAVNYPQFMAGGTELAAWRVTGFPETFVFVREGIAWKLKRKFISEITRENLEYELK
ncbi:MAG: TlpA disulfide reductase family protein [Spirochaetota bacterium]